MPGDPVLLTGEEFTLSAGAVAVIASGPFENVEGSAILSFSHLKLSKAFTNVKDLLQRRT